MKKNGFTLVELMVGLAIFAVVGGFGLNYINGFGARQDLGAVRDEVVSAIRLARNYAVTQQKASGFVGEMRYVSVNIGSSLVSIYPDVNTATPYYSKNFTSNSVIISKSNGNDTIRFSSFEGKMVGTTGVTLGVGSSVMITLTSVTGTTSVVIIDSLGVVNE